MKVRNNVSDELRILLTKDLEQYKAEIQMNDSEYKELCWWVRNGHSPYDNAWDIATDAGIPMDYISAKRVVESGTELIPAYDTVNDEPLLLLPDDEDDVANEELPF